MRCFEWKFKQSVQRTQSCIGIVSLGCFFGRHSMRTGYACVFDFVLRSVTRIPRGSSPSGRPPERVPIPPTKASASEHSAAHQFAIVSDIKSVAPRHWDRKQAFSERRKRNPATPDRPGANKSLFCRCHRTIGNGVCIVSASVQIARCCSRRHASWRIRNTVVQFTSRNFVPTCS